MLEIIGGLFTSVLSGGATGLIGVLLQRYFDLQHKKQDIEIIKLNHQNTLELSKLESARADSRNAAEVSMAEVDAEARGDEAASKSLIAALENDKATYLDKGAQSLPGFVGGAVTLMMGFVDFLRGFIRPGMTAYLCVLVTYMFMWARNLMDVHGISFTPEQITGIVVQIVSTILYVWTTVSLFWFGTRPPKSAEPK